MNVTLESRHREELIEHARRAAPEECCGLLCGSFTTDGVVVGEIQPMPNVWSGDRGHRYEIDPRAHLNLQRDARTRGIEIVGYYHSHPDAPPVPSAFDTERAWEQILYVIVTPLESEEHKIRAWVYDEGSVSWSEAMVD
jgi:proteasome lid subunit RPN8/RPN11